MEKFTVKQLNTSTESNGSQPFQQNRVYSVYHKSPAHLATLTGGGIS